MFLVQDSRVLVVCAHTDDEFGCAGAVARLLEEGREVNYVALSRCEESVPDGLPADVLEVECRACTALLGIPAANVHVMRYRVRHFPEFRQSILEDMVALRKQIQPTLVMLPSSFDTHQDHQTIYEEGFRAFKSASILGYELPQNLISFSNSTFVRLAERQLQRKVDALAKYRSQEFRPYSSETFVRSLAVVRGVQCGASYAEAFEAVRLIAG